MESRPITDPAEIAILQRQHDMAVIEAVLKGLCGLSGVAVGQVCVRPYGHGGVHRSEWWEWED